MDETLGAEELEEVLRTKEAHTNAAILESVGDIPDADIKPPDNVLFVCKLNPVTQDEDLFTIFSRFGTVTSADIIRDYKTGDSLCYAFIEFETKEACERAYFKMDNTLIDDRRIHVDFSQSVAKLWSQYRHGKKGNANKGGCFKCGDPGHIARDCEQGSDNKQKGSGSKYVLKNGDTQHGGADLKRYDMLFDEDNAENNREQEERRKRQKSDHHRSDVLYRKDYDKKHSERHWSNNDKGRHSREDERRKEDSRRSHDKYHREKGAEERSEGREHRNHKRTSGSNQHRKDEGDHRRSIETDLQRRESHSEKKHRDRDDEAYRERRRRDDRRK